MTRPNNQTTVIVAHQFETLEQQFDADLLGMWLFLVTEALLFSGAFLALAVYYHQYYDTFSAAARELPPTAARTSPPAAASAGSASPGCPSPPPSA